MMTEKELADKIIKEMEDAGMTPDQMLEVIKLAKLQYKKLKKN